MIRLREQGAVDEVLAAYEWTRQHRCVLDRALAYEAAKAQRRTSRRIGCANPLVGRTGAATAQQQQSTADSS